MFSPALTARAGALVARCAARGLKIATAESCTGGLVAGLLTEIAGSSDVFERGFVTYSNDAKREMLGVRVWGKTLGILGMGGIGRAFAARARLIAA